MTLIVEGKRAEAMLAVFEQFEGEPVLRRLHIRIEELGQNHLDELAQHHLLLRAMREDDAFASAMTEAGFGAAAKDDPRDPEVGRVVQVFNRMIEDHWEVR